VIPTSPFPVPRLAALARHATPHLLEATLIPLGLLWWAFCSLSASPGARACYDRHRAQGATHQQALRALANRWVGILHGCLRHRTLYDEAIAWPNPQQPQQHAA